jgi:hypothetical protein
MRITDATVIVCSAGRNFVTLKVTTEDGIMDWVMPLCQAAGSRGGFYAGF